MGSIGKGNKKRAQETVSFENPFQLKSISTNIVRTEIDQDLNISATLKPDSSPILSLELSDDIDAISDFSRQMSHTVADDDNGPRSFLLKSDVPRVFFLGGDLALFRYYIERQDAESLKRYARKGVRVTWGLIDGFNSNRLTISFVNGEAQSGGFEVALACNVFISTKNASYGFPEPLYGLFPGMGATPLLTSRADAHAAKTLLSSSGRYPAELLYEMGVVDYLIEETELPDLISELKLKMKTNRSTDEFSRRFSQIRYEDLVDTADDWASQALCLEPKNIEVMGGILRSHNRSLNQR